MNRFDEDLSLHYEICPACNRLTLITKYLEKENPMYPNKKDLWKDMFCPYCKFKQTQRYPDLRS
ncbi:MAG: hypothetical protein NUV31_04315 [Dehalococcoidales bacterium]|jgi:hypothetical protein|nr:hypothetical protein [Dehalococcoidales bacterium]